MKRQIQDLDRVAFGVSCLLLVFAYGVGVGHYEIVPHSMLKFAQDSVEQVLAEKDTILYLRPSRRAVIGRASRTGLARHRRPWPRGGGREAAPPPPRPPAGPAR
jgi:hypothetical protein